MRPTTIDLYKKITEKAEKLKKSGVSGYDMLEKLSDEFFLAPDSIKYALRMYKKHRAANE